MLVELRFCVLMLALLAATGCIPATSSGSSGTPSATNSIGPTKITAGANGFATGPDSTSNYIENSAQEMPTATPGVKVELKFFDDRGVHIDVDEGPVDWVEVTVTGELLDGSTFPESYRLRYSAEERSADEGKVYFAINEEVDTFLHEAAGREDEGDYVKSWRYVHTDKRGAGGPYTVYFTDGVKTKEANLPTATAKYSGDFFGESTISSGSHEGDWWTYASLSMDMNFDAGKWDGTMDNFLHVDKDNTDEIVTVDNWEGGDYPSLPLSADLQGIIDGSDFHGIMRITNQGNPGYVPDKSVVIGSFFGPNGEEAAGSIGFNGTKPEGGNRANLQLRGGFLTKKQ